MKSFLNYSVLFLVAFIATSFFTWVLTYILPSLGLVDVPNSRRAHSKVTPRGGGLAIVVAVIIILSIYDYFSSSLSLETIKCFPLLILISLILFIDDIIIIPIFIRLITHIVCPAIAIKLFLPFNLLFSPELPLYIHFVLIVIGLTTFLNIYNFTNRVDGISCADSAHLSVTLLILYYLEFEIIINLHFIVVMNILILACLLSFLILNWHPAKLFLGNVGSISLRFMFGVCLLFISASSLNLLIPSFIASLYYLADGGVTILIILLKKENIWQPHLQHFFKRLLEQVKPMGR